MNALMFSLAFWLFDGSRAADVQNAVCPFNNTAVYCGEDGDKTVCCPGDAPLCCAVGKLGCCPSGKPWACSSPRNCYATEEETVRCEGLVTQCL